MASKAARICGAIAALAALAAAAQPGAVKPVAVPMRDLKWGTLNFLHTTDTHGWHAGHLQESQYSADWGDYVSFAEHMRRKADEQGVDLLLVDTGDRVEGNGLYDASTPKGKYYYDIYRQQNVDIICTGNHELYQASTADQEHLQTVPNFRNNYIASNLDYVDPKTGERSPMAQRYRRFKTKNQRIDIVAFGFLFDFTGNAKNTVVQPVKKTIQEDWFQKVVRESRPDVFVVIGHVGVQMQEFKDIFRAIRLHNPNTPIVFFGGHVHVRDATSYDSRSFAIASGRYFETIGWMSVELGSDAPSFHRRYIDNNILGLYHHTGLNASTFPTEHGRNVTSMIAKARAELDLDYIYGCAPKDYWMTRAPYPHENSIYSLLEKQILPAIVVNPKRAQVPRLAIMNTGAIRFDIFKGAFTRDTTFIVSPFLSVLNYIPDVPYRVARKVLGLLNSGGQIMDEDFVPWHLMAIPEQQVPRKSVIYEKKPPKVSDSMGQQVPLGRFGGGDDAHDGPVLIEGYTTKDDIGDDGDDAVHANIDFHVVPNCIQAEIAFPKEKEPETVDLVFFDFIQPWVLFALKVSGGNQTAADVKSYVPDTFSDLMSEWMKKNWPRKCD
ncbi:Metallo-dependent phosphatase-like protein [Echria macrotheca]|uniref:Metallo-dependent phosphatase-like protein n=1 Tax=Echria macrotheca TaxID=438768 RepID=A0AAJ0FEE3_9PEZI|nr:Metallo-dependent phosphatase-like protein [Echria macrotheca]